MSKKENQPKPKPRKYPHLWQAYLHWYELMEMRKRHNLRISAVEREASNLDAQFEQDVLDHMQMEGLIKYAKKQMVSFGKATGDIWDWLTAIRGLGEGGLAAQLLAQVDDIETFETTSQLWRFCGYGLFQYWVGPDGKRKAPRQGWKWYTNGNKERVKAWTIVTPRPWDESTEKLDYNGDPVTIKFMEPHPDWTLKWLVDQNMEGWHGFFNGKLKGVCFNIADQFVRQQTPNYVPIYYKEKDRQRELHPKPTGKKYTKGHIDFMARRKMIKEFLKDFWLSWRSLEGLPITDPFDS